MREFHGENIPRPPLDFQWSALPSAVEVDLEIGAGQGLHAIQYCRAHPERLLIAVEKTHQRFHALKGRLERHPELKNLHVIHADAVAFVRHFVPDGGLDRVFLLYPNPYPKARQANLRWHNRPFFGELVRKMTAHGELTLATNLEWYADQAESRIPTLWPLALSERQPVDVAQAPRTHFEKKYLSRGEICWNLRFRKGPNTHDACLFGAGKVQ